MIVVTVENAESLYQYDMNRLIIISGLDPGPTYEIHFTNNNMNYVICKETTVDESGNIIAKIPNSLLQTTQPITLYVYGITDNVSKTYYKSWLEIKPRPKPDGYVLPDDEDDVARYSKLEKQIEDTRGDVYDLSEFVHSDIDTRLDNIENGNTTVKKALYAEGADIANSAAMDALGNDIPETYATNEAVGVIQKAVNVHDNVISWLDLAVAKLMQEPITTIPSTLDANMPYNFGEQTERALIFPTIATDGDVIYITFTSGATATNLTVDTTNTSDFDLIPEANTGYEIYAKYNGTIWIVKYSEYTVSGV